MGNRSRGKRIRKSVRKSYRRDLEQAACYLLQSIKLVRANQLRLQEDLEANRETLTWLNNVLLELRLTEEQQGRAFAEPLHERASDTLARGRAYGDEILREMRRQHNADMKRFGDCDDD